MIKLIARVLYSFLFLVSTPVFGVVSFAKHDEVKASSSQKSHPVKKNKDHLKSIAVLQEISKCLSKEKKVEDIRLCASKYFYSGSKKEHIDRILVWFEHQDEMSHPVVCPTTETEFIPAAILQQSKLVLCAEFKKESLSRKALFFMVEEKNKIKLLNIKEQ